MSKMEGEKEHSFGLMLDFYVNKIRWLKAGSRRTQLNPSGAHFEMGCVHPQDVC